jgi:hypothetical protein
MPHKEETLRLLREWNVLDIELYAYARKLAIERMKRLSEVFQISTASGYETKYLPSCMNDTMLTGAKKQLLSMGKQFKVFPLNHGGPG